MALKKMTQKANGHQMAGRCIGALCRTRNGAYRRLFSRAEEPTQRPVAWIWSEAESLARSCGSPVQRILRRGLRNWNSYSCRAVSHPSSPRKSDSFRFSQIV